MNPSSISKASQRVDEILRARLGVSDVRDPRAVLPALKKLFPTQVKKLDLETHGFAITPTSAPIVTPPPAGNDRAGEKSREAEQDVQVDLDYITNHAAVRTWKAEHQRWRANIADDIAETYEAARQSVDASQLDRAVLGIRRLQEHALLARLLSGRNQPMLSAYRRLATGLDRCAMSARVLIGDVLYEAERTHDASAAGARSADLAARRDAVLAGLRFALGVSADPADAAEASAGLKQLYDALHGAAAAELVQYLNEPMLAPVLDTIVREASERNGNDGALGPRSALHVNRLVELRDTLSPIPNKPSGIDAFYQALVAFLASSQTPVRGSRYIHIATPLQFAAWQEPDPDQAGRNKLSTLVALRGALERAIEADAECCTEDADTRSVRGFVDTLLLAADRTIELWATGSGGDGVANRAPGAEENLAMGYARHVYPWFSNPLPMPSPARVEIPPAGSGLMTAGEVHDVGFEMRQQLLPALANRPPPPPDFDLLAIREHGAALLRAAELADNLGPVES